MSLRRTNYKTAKEFYYPSSQLSSTSVKIQQHKNQETDTSGVNLEYTILKYVNSANPEVWGPSFWFTLHNGAARYPLNASPITIERMKGFILGLPVMVPCETCKEHATAFIEANYNNLDNICSGRMKLFNFFVDFHNKVNKRYNKPIMGYKDAYALYTDEATVSKLTYN